MSRDYDHWLSEVYDYQDLDGCSMCWINEHPNATDEQIDEASCEMGLCGVHEHEAYTDYVADRIDRAYEQFRDNPYEWLREE